MRKLFLSLAAMLFMAGIVLAAEVTLVSFDEKTKEVTVKEGDKEVKYKLTDKTKVSMVDKDGKSTEGTMEKAVKALSNEKAKGKLKFDIKTDKGDITEITMKGGKKGDK
ncbi:MAG: hypothetical protein C0501_12505 [Isosphaera sp.]|nr:hypothetical protein [Isosphaera sp.]